MFAGGLLGRVRGQRPEGASAAGVDPVDIGFEAHDPSGVAFPAVGDASVVNGTASLNGIPYSCLIDRQGLLSADTAREDAVAPADPSGIWGNLLTARAEGAGFPAVVAADVVTPQGTVSGLPLNAISAPDGSRYADVDAEDDAAPADPRGTYPLAVARAAGGGAGVAAGDAVAFASGTGGVLYTNPASADLARVADVVTEDAVAPVDPTGQFTMLTARAEGAGFPAVTAADNVTPQGSTAGIQFVNLAAPDGSRVSDIDAENEPAPAAPRGLYAGGRSTTALIALTDGDYAVLNFDLSGRLRTVNAAPGAGHDAIHNSGTSAALAAGANTVTVYTVSALRFFRLRSIICRYAGTVTGVTLQLQVGGVRADVAVGGLTSGVDVDLLASGREIDADAAETVQILVTGATAPDTITWSLHGDEEAV